MPTKKQRRRQQKSRRHDWEYVYVDDAGHEVEVDPGELKAKREEKTQARERKPAANNGRPGRPGRTVEPPSWARVRKRALMVGPVLVIAMLLLNRNLPVIQRVIPAVVMLAFFLPFSYFTDSLAYKMYRKRIDRLSGGATKKT